QGGTEAPTDAGKSSGNCGSRCNAGGDTCGCDSEAGYQSLASGGKDKVDDWWRPASDRNRSPLVHLGNFSRDNNYGCARGHQRLVWGIEPPEVWDGTGRLRLRSAAGTPLRYPRQYGNSGVSGKHSRPDRPDDSGFFRLLRTERFFHHRLAPSLV